MPHVDETYVRTPHTRRVSRADPTDAPLDVLSRWEEAGGTWEVLAVDRTGPTTGLTVALCTCTGGEEVDRLVTDDPEVAAYVAP